MKPRPLQALLTALAIEVGSCFVPNKMGRTSTIAQWKSLAPCPLFSSYTDDGPLDSATVLSAYEEWREKFGKGGFDTKRFPNFENNFKVLTNANIQARDRALAEGKAPPQWLELNEYGDFSREEYKAMKEGLQRKATETASGAQGTRPIRSTQVITPPERGTQVVRKADASSPPQEGPRSQTSQMSGTTWGPESFQGTQKVTQYPNETSNRGTQVIQKAGEQGPPGRPTQVVQPSGYQEPSTGTKSSSQGTQVIQKAGERPPARQVVQPSGYQPAPTSSPPVQGTQVIRRDENSSQEAGGADRDESKRGTYVVRAGTQSQQGAQRGTVVIPQAVGAPSYFSDRGVSSQAATSDMQQGPTAASTNYSEATSGRGTVVIKNDQANSNKEGKSLSEFFGENGTGAQVIRSVGDQASSSIFSLFGGSKMAEDLPSTVRGSVVVDGGKSSDDRRETVLVNKADVQSIIPSIFSFFGLTKNDDATQEEQQEASVPEPAKPKPKDRPSLLIDKNSMEFPRGSELPEVRRWWQNADGSITGYIYNSKNFNDGTKLNTSPMQRAATKSGNLVRSGGEDYILK